MILTRTLLKFQMLPQDDKQSLAELHDYLSGNTPPDTPQAEFAVLSATPRAERRRSLPSRTSMVSMVSISEFSIISPDADETTFQQRRRKAAKLTQFFGVNYRDVMNEILESIEKGLEEERRKGTLKPSEVQVRVLSLCVRRGAHLPSSAGAGTEAGQLKD